MRSLQPPLQKGRYSVCQGVGLSWELICVPEEKTSIIQGDVTFLPISDSSADIIISTAVIEHTPNPLTLLNEAVRILRQNGLFIITSPDPF